MTFKKNIIILGGAGFLGSFLSERLLKSANVICIDDFISSNQSNINHLLKLSNFELIKHNLKEPINLDELPDLNRFQLDVHGISEVYNLACPISIKNFERLRIETALANSVVVKNALDLALKYKAKFMHFSSSVVYGEVKKGTFVKEDFLGKLDNLAPRACYEEGKRFSETLVKTYNEVHKLDTKIVRIFPTYGPKMPLNDGQMIPDFIVNALDNKDLIIFGDDQMTTSLCYVSDIVEGAVKLMALDIKEPINLGSTNVYRLKEVAEKIIELTNSKSKIVYKKEISHTHDLALPDISKAKDLMGWFPIITLNDGLRKAIDYTRAHKNLLTLGK